jgi:WhiB family transcriptional regulator, redox-sensing transcriptional regulator
MSPTVLSGNTQVGRVINNTGALHLVGGHGSAEIAMRPGGSMDTEWMARGNCASQPPSLFFPSDGVGVEIARRICATCPVKNECLEHALVNRIDHGVWGGASERERRRILKRRRNAALSGTRD